MSTLPLVLTQSAPARSERAIGAAPIPLRHSLLLAAATFLAGLTAPALHQVIFAAPQASVAERALEVTKHQDNLMAAIAMHTAKPLKLLADDRIERGVKPVSKPIAYVKPQTRTLTAANSCTITPPAPATAQAQAPDKAIGAMNAAGYAAAIGQTATALNAVSAAINGALQQ